MSPTQRSLAALRKAGYTAAVVEKYNHHTHRKHDLFGVIDVLGIRAGETIAVQTTSGSHVANRITKIKASPALAEMLAAGWKVVVHGWRKAANGRWTLREEIVT